VIRRIIHREKPIKMSFLAFGFLYSLVSIATFEWGSIVDAFVALINLFEVRTDWAYKYRPSISRTWWR